MRWLGIWMRRWAGPDGPVRSAFRLLLGGGRELALAGGGCVGRPPWQGLRHAFAAKGGGGTNEDDRLSTRRLLRRLIIARNAAAVRQLAKEEGLSAEALAAIAREVLAEQQEVGTEDRLGARYDIHSGKYATLEEFVAALLAGA